MKKIFIVEDEMILNERLKKFLEKNGYAVEIFPYGEHCLERLDTGALPDLILMDINLGKHHLDGPAVTKKIYSKYDIPVILHSAYTDKATLDSTKDMTKYGYIQKVPGNEQFILATIEMAFKLHSTEVELKRSERMYKELSKHLQNVREEQNAELSREIHDDLGQSLTAIKMNLTVLGQMLEKDGTSKDELKETVEGIEEILGGTVKKVRKLSSELRPSVVDSEGIVEALEWEVEEFKKKFAISVSFHGNRDEVEFDKEKNLHIFRIVQEALTNCVRHSAADTIDVVTDVEKNTFLVFVEDNGKGFEIDSIEESENFGLIGMKERAKQCEGTLHIESEKRRGTKVELRIPLN